MLKSDARAATQIPLRLAYLGAGAAAFILFYLAGASAQLTTEEARVIAEPFFEHAQNIDEAGIFLNNFQIAIGMFVPGFGVGLGTYSAYSTGETFKALTVVEPSLANIHPLSAFMTPFAILEILAYGLAISRSALLTFDLIKKRRLWKRFLPVTLIELGIVIIVLIVGALIEGQVLR